MLLPELGKFRQIAQKFMPKSLHSGSVPINSPSAFQMLGMTIGSGVAVNERTAMGVSAVNACVRILAESIASLPCKVYRKTDKGREEAGDVALWKLLRRQPNEWQTPFEFFEMHQGILGLRGNSYSYIHRFGGEPVELIPLQPERVGIMKLPNGQPVYTYDGKTYLNTEILHIRSLSRDGYTGLSPLHLLAETFGLSIATRNHASTAFGNGATPGGVLTSPVELDPKQIEQLREDWDKRHKGVANTGRPAILYGGMEWTTVSFNAKDAQMLESRKFEVEEIARAYRIPLHLLQSTEKSTTWGSGIEQMNIGFVEYTLRPWLVRWEQAMNRVLLTEAQKDAGYYVEFNLDALLRGDFKTRMEGYAQGVTNGILTPNEVRERENLPRLDSKIGDITYLPINTVPAGTPQTNNQLP